MNRNFNEQMHTEYGYVLITFCKDETPEFDLIKVFEMQIEKSNMKKTWLKFDP